MMRIFALLLVYDWAFLYANLISALVGRPWILLAFMHSHARRAGARIVRHNALNDQIFRALVKAGVPSIKEPSGLLRSDGKRPDGVTQIPWASGKCLAWNVTVTHTLAPSYSHLSSISAGKVAERAAEM